MCCCWPGLAWEEQHRALWEEQPELFLQGRSAAAGGGGCGSISWAAACGPQSPNLSLELDANITHAMPRGGRSASSCCREGPLSDKSLHEVPRDLLLLNLCCRRTLTFTEHRVAAAAPRRLVQMTGLQFAAVSLHGLPGRSSSPGGALAARVCERSGWQAAGRHGAAAAAAGRRRPRPGQAPRRLGRLAAGVTE